MNQWYLGRVADTLCRMQKNVRLLSPIDALMSMCSWRLVWIVGCHADVLLASGCCSLLSGCNVASNNNEHNNKQDVTTAAVAAAVGDKWYNGITATTATSATSTTVATAATTASTAASATSATASSNTSIQYLLSQVPCIRA